MIRFIVENLAYIREVTPPKGRDFHVGLIQMEFAKHQAYLIDLINMELCSGRRLD